MADDLSYIAEPLRKLAIPIADLAPDPENIRKHDKKNVEAVTNSLKNFGQRMPIVVQKEGMIIRAGNCRTEAAKSLGWTHIAAVILDDDEITAKAFAIADNRAGELGEWDYKLLQETLQELQQEIDWADEIGWTAEEVMTLTSATWEPPVVDDLPIPADEKSQEKIKAIELSRGQRQMFEQAFKLAKENGIAKTEGAFIESLSQMFLASND